MTTLSSLDLRQAIINRVQNKNSTELTEVIEDSIGQDERALPGLGVLFEMIWQHADDNDHNHMIQLLHKHLQHTAQ